ncbi:PAS domain-containing sensor histidine kinase [Pseudozobellia sp. WGM2]|uniref:PAS domain-containing sensor histidine kinase n=1 Tax=Pseudozobellia sp. WGM2 TaxID=2787625 RepID=UPI001AE07684|nr:PAS domain-containing sensor histidine kinase [Pseudozobellia sp. WGM2]
MFNRFKPFGKDKRGKKAHKVPRNLIEKTNKIAKIGIYEFNSNTGETYWNAVLKEILEVSDDYKPSFDSVLGFCKDDQTRTQLSRLNANAIETGETFEFEYSVISAKGNLRHIWAFNQPEFNDDDSYRLYGTLIDITELKKNEQALIRNKHQWNFVEQMAMIGYWSWDVVIDDFKWSDNVYRIYDFEIGIPMNFERFLSKVHPEDREMVTGYAEEFKRTKVFRKFNHRSLHEDGSVHTIEIMGQIITSSTGEVVEMVGTTQDITERNQYEKEVLKNIQLLNFTTQMTKVGYWEWDSVSDANTWSDTLYQICEREKGDKLTHETYLEYTHPDDRDFVIDQIKKALLAKKLPVFEHRLVVPSGNIKIIQVTGQVNCNEEGEVIGLLGTCQDVTEINKSQDELIEKNRLLNIAEEMAMLGYWTWNPHKDEFRWSDNLYRIFGFETGIEMSLKLLSTRVHPDDQEKIKNITLEFLDTKVFRKFTYRIIRENEIRTLEVTGDIIKNKDNQELEIFGTTQDITDRIKNELEILDKNKFLNMAEQMAMSGHWRWKPNTDEFEWSDNMYRINDFELGTKMSMELFTTRFHPDDIEPVKIFGAKTIETNTFNDFTHRIIRTNGEVRTLKVIGEILNGENDDEVEFVGVTRDITEQIASEKRLLESNIRLDKAAKILTAKNRKLAEFNQITSHNLRAPVSNLNTLLHLYKDEAMENNKEILFEKFDKVIGHLTLTLNTLIESLNTEKLSFEDLESLSFEDILVKTEEMLSAQIMNSGAVIKSDFSSAKKITYNRIYLESIFLNLVGNAIKYSSPERAPMIEVRSSVEDDNRIKLEFKDNGLGIDLKKHGHKLFGLNKVFHRHPEAKGIGLFLTKAQIEAMGGSIYAESEVDVGTTFFINFS